jgi:hypothetical protein
VEREFDAHCSESVAVKAPEALALAQFGETGFDDGSAVSIFGASRGLV